MEDKKEKKKPSLGMGCLGFLILVIIVYFIMFSGDDGEDEKETSYINLNASVRFTGTQFIIKNDDNSKVNGYRGGESIDIIDSEKVKLINVKNCKAVIQRNGKGPETIKCKNLGDIASAGGGNKGLLSTKSSSKTPFALPAYALSDQNMSMTVSSSSFDTELATPSSFDK